MASALESLPAELQAHIIDHIGSPYQGFLNRTCLLPLSLTSKTLHDATTPVLYSTFNSGETCKSVRPFLRSICSNAVLHKLVRNMHLELHHEKPSAPTSFDFALFSAALTKGMKAGPMRQRILSALRAGCHSAELLVISCMTTQITRLTAALIQSDIVLDTAGQGLVSRFIRNRCADCPVLGQGLAHIVFSHASHTRLETATLLGGDGCLHGRPDQGQVLLDALSVESLRSLKCHRLRLPAGLWRDPAIQHTSNVRAVSLFGCDVEASVLNSILTACKTLENLEYIDRIGCSSRTFDISACHPSLYKHRDSLNVLSLMSGSKTGGPFRNQPALGSLLDFTRLDRLIIDELLFTGGTTWNNVNLAGTLPKSLSRLRVISHGELAEDLGNILVAFSGWKPAKLDCVEIVFVVDGERNKSHLRSWQIDENGEWRCPGHLLGYGGNDRGTSLVIEGSQEDDDYSIEFTCTEPEVCHGLAKFGRELVEKGLEHFSDAAYWGKKVRLWEGGPVKNARSMFFDTVLYD